FARLRVGVYQPAKVVRVGAVDQLAAYNEGGAVVLQPVEGGGKYPDAIDRHAIEPEGSRVVVRGRLQPAGPVAPEPFRGEMPPGAAQDGERVRHAGVQCFTGCRMTAISPDVSTTSTLPPMTAATSCRKAALASR